MYSINYPPLSKLLCFMPVGTHIRISCKCDVTEFCSLDWSAYNDWIQAEITSSYIRYYYKICIKLKRVFVYIEMIITL